MRLQKTIIVALLSCMVFVAMGQQTTAPLPVSKNGFVVIAHRGSHLVKPENTLAAIEAAIKEGADYVEVDLRTTKDGHLMLCHDDKVDRTTNGKGLVKELDWSEIAMLTTVGKDKKVYHVPDFKEVLKTCKDRINIYLDFKDADVAATYAEIKAAGMEKNIVVYLNKVDQYMSWRKNAPAMPLMASLPESISTKEDLLDLLDKMQLEVLDNVTDSAMLAVTRQNGIHVWLDVQSADEGLAKWSEAMNRGIQGVQTDHPAALTKYLAKNNLRSGATVLPVVFSPKAAPAYRKLSDVPYSLASAENIMDVYFPQVYDDAKVILYIHGGSWVSGDKGEFPKSLVEELVGKKIYIVVSMNYRLIKDGKNRFPSQMEDVTAAIKYLSSASKKFHFNGNEFALMGGSAGGLMAMLYAYGYDEKKQIKTVIDFWGPTDLTDKAVRTIGSDADRISTNLLGDADAQAKISFDASPYYRITKESAVPTIFFHGGADPLVPVSQAEKMYKKMLSLNIPAQYEMYPDEKHGIGGATRVDAFAKTIVWLDKYFPAK
jgi:glycerophosphoryl diester phosphodiesterase/dienelactone hydrolase